MNPEELLDRLAVLGEVTRRSLFGGHGIYWRGVIFAILFQDRLYLKVDEGNRGDYLARGMGPFCPSERQTLRSYHEVPPEVAADTEILVSWAREAIRGGDVVQGTNPEFHIDRTPAGIQPTSLTGPGATEDASPSITSNQRGERSSGWPL